MKNTFLRTCIVLWGGLASVLGMDAAPTVLWGVAPDYAGQTLRLTTLHDGLSEQPDPIATDTVAPDGRFAFRFDLDRTCRVAVDLGYYRGCIYLEPGANEQAQFPDYQPLTEAQKFNPYFRPKAVILSIVNPAENDLNVRIEAFDELCDSIWSELLFEPDITPTLLERSMELIESRFPCKEQDFFFRYKRYNYAMLVNLYRKASPALAVENYFRHDSIDYANPAYWEAFDLVFELFDRVEALEDNRPLYELVQINRVIRRKLPVEWLDSVATPQLRPTAQHIARQLTAGRMGSRIAGGWIGLQGDSIPAADPYGRPTYLLFANRRIIESQSDIAYVQGLARKWERKCRFVVVFANEDSVPQMAPSDDIDYLCTQHNPNILSDLGVRNLPCYFLLDGEGRIEQSPAPDPEHYLPE